MRGPLSRFGARVPLYMGAALCIGLATPTTAGVPSNPSYEDIPNAPVTVPDLNCGNPIVRTFWVLEPFTVSDLNVGFIATNTRRGDIRMELVSPSGTRVRLVNNNTSDANDHYNVLLDSASANPLNDGNNDATTPVYSRTAAPSNSLNAFNGENAYGPWTLEVCDNRSGRVTQYLRARLDFTSAALPGVRGFVYEDFNGDGTRDALEPGMENVTVTAYDFIGTVLGTATTDEHGYYEFPGIANGVDVRVEFTNWPAGWEPAPAGPDCVSTVGFVTSPAQASCGYIKPATYVTEADAWVVTNCYLFGPQPLQNSMGSDVLVVYPYTAGCVDDNLDGICDDGGNVNLPAPSHGALGSELGTTWGLAYHRGTDSTFAAAFMKRHAGFRNFGETGNIYRITGLYGGGSPSISLYVDLDSLGFDTGTDPHPPDTIIGDNWARDADSWDWVGKMSLGDIDLNEDQTHLYAVNLFSRELVEIPIQSAPLVAGDINTYTLPSPPDCPDADDVRPFATGSFGDLMYVGITCTAESTQVPADMRAYVYSFDPAVGVSSFMQVLNFPLNYPRACVVRATTGGSCTTAAWNPWSPTFIALPTLYTACCDEVVYPQPWLSDIEFDGDGNMLLGFRDRYGDQMGYLQLSTDPMDAELYQGDAAGDLLKACGNPDSGWILESNATCGGFTSPGSGGNQGPGGGEFFYEEHYVVHDEISLGGLAVGRGFPDFIFSGYDPIYDFDEPYDGGIFWTRYSDGSRTRTYKLYDSDLGNPDTFSKGGGLGDVEILMPPAPVEIGNRVWIDINNNGRQDPGEEQIPGVELRLECPAEGIDETTTTDANGEYYFNDSNVPGGIPFGAVCTVSIDMAQVAISGAGYTPTTPNQSGSTIDSNGVFSPDRAPFVVADIVIGEASENDHTIDFGFNPVVLAVDLIEFNATTDGYDRPVQVSWATASEIDNVGFNLYRATLTGSGWVAGEKLNASVIPPAPDADLNGGSYAFTDTDLIGEGESRAYLLEDIDASGVTMFHGPALVTAPTVDDYWIDSGLAFDTLDLTYWEFLASDTYEAPGHENGEDMLGFSVAGPRGGSPDQFGFWQTKGVLRPLPAGRHVLRVHVEWEVEEGSYSPSVRLRPFELDHGTNWMTQIVDWHNRLKELPATIETVWESDGETPWMLAIDMLAFGEDLAGRVRITGVESVPLNE